jgi:cyclophilin family peptidyl-prolyl cis-trans isomerase
MSNKILAYILIAIVIILAGGFVAWRVMSDKVVGPGVQDNQQPQQQAANQNQDSQKLPTNATSSMDTASTTPSDSATCKRDFNADTLKTAKVNTKNRQVEISVKDFGNITVQLYDQDAPKTVENFLRLANAGYYDCVTFHRVARNFMIQGGDPTGTGSGGDSAFGGPFADELNAGTPSYKAGYVKGVLAMANAGPNTNSSQFFIMIGDVPLQHDYTIFGKVIVGQDVADKIGQTPISPNLQMDPNGGDGAPKSPVVMQSVKIIK